MNQTSKRGRTSGIALWDVLVTIAISIVAMAIGVGLFMQFEAEFPFALLAAFFTYVGLLTAHVSVKRAQRVRELEDEIAHLQNALENLADMQSAWRSEPQPASDATARASSPPASVIAGVPSTLAPPHPSERFFPERNAYEPSPPILSGLGYPTLSFEPPRSEHVPAAQATNGEMEMAGVSGLAPRGDEIDDQAVTAGREVLPAREDGKPIEDAVAPTSSAVGDGSVPSRPPHEAPTVAGAAGFETMQVLIQQLAAQLVAPNPPVIQESELESDPAATESATGSDIASAAQTAIDQSVGMLRAAAETLRHEPEAATEVAANRSGIADIVAGVAPRLVPPPDQPPSPYSRLALIAEALASDRIQVLLEPILDLGERRARHFEVSVRLHSPEGDDIDIAARTSSAVESGLIARIDAAKLARTAHVAERLRARGSEASLFARLTGDSLSDDGFRATAADVLAGETPVASGLVIAFAQSDVRSFTAAHWEAIATMAELGLQFSVEDITDLDMDFEELIGRGVQFVKLDAEVYLRGLPTPGGAIPASDLCNWFSGLGLSLIVGRIDDEDALARIVESGAPLGQGPLFGARRPVAVDNRPSARASVA